MSTICSVTGPRPVTHRAIRFTSDHCPYTDDIDHIKKRIHIARTNPEEYLIDKLTRAQRFQLLRDKYLIERWRAILNLVKTKLNATLDFFRLSGLGQAIKKFFGFMMNKLKSTANKIRMRIKNIKKQSIDDLRNKTYVPTTYEYSDL